MARHQSFIVGSALGIGVALLTRRMTQTFGLNAGEKDATLPGDTFLPNAPVVATRAVNIDAPARCVWPWIVQLGYGRAGFYSFDWLQRRMGIDLHNADRVEPLWQDLAVGDTVRLAEPLALTVVALEKNSHMVIGGGAAVPGAVQAQHTGGHAGSSQGDPPFDFTWAFVIEPRGVGSRLLVRERYRPHNGLGRAQVEAVQVPSFIMSARMLYGIKDRAERLEASER